MTSNNSVSFDRCSCGWLADTEYNQVLHYAKAHNNSEPLIEFLNKRVDDTLQHLRSELVKYRPLIHVTEQDIGFDKGIQTAMRLIDRKITQFKE